jgi:hypothetical protein
MHKACIRIEFAQHELSACPFVFCELELAVRVNSGAATHARYFEIEAQGILDLSRLRRFGGAASLVVSSRQQQDNRVAIVVGCEIVIRERKLGRKLRGFQHRRQQVPARYTRSLCQPEGVHSQSHDAQGI